MLPPPFRTRRRPAPRRAPLSEPKTPRNALAPGASPGRLDDAPERLDDAPERLDDAPERLDDALRERIRDHLGRFERVVVEPEGRRAAAVAVTLVPAEDGDEPCFLITRRASTLRNHGGQWALPGGSLDPGETAVDAARRELHEELGVECGPEHVLGLLDDYATRSGFVITPVVVFASDAAELVPDPSEVAAAYRVPIEVLEGREVPHLRRIPESDRPVISIPMLGTHIHAPTAAILFQLREVALWGRGTRVGHFEQPVFAWR